MQSPSVATAPAMLRWQDSFALLYKQVKRTGLAVPESGIRRIKPADFIEAWGEAGQVLLPNQRQSSGLAWDGLNHPFNAS